MSWGLDHYCLLALFPKLYLSYASSSFGEELFWHLVEALTDSAASPSSMVGRADFYSKLEQFFRHAGEMDPVQRQTSLKKHQLALWKKLFLEGKTRWDHLKKWQKDDPQASVAKEALGPCIDFFGVDWLSPFQLEILQWLSHSIEITLYAFSPSSSFWGEGASRPRKHLLIRGLLQKELSDHDLEKVEQVLEEPHPLLASYGTFAKSFLHSLEDYGALIKGVYPHKARQSYFCQSIFSEEVVWGVREPSLLDHLKEGLLLCPIQKNIREQTGLVVDGSLKVHCAPDLSEQVLLVQDEIRRALLEGFAPEDILVLAPEMHRFKAWITSVFSDRSLVDVGFRLWSTRVDSSHWFSCFSCWMRFMLSEWGKEDVLELLSEHHWGERFQFDRTVWRNFVALFEQQPYFWGYDARHQAICLHQIQGSKQGKTWQEVTFGLLLSLLSFPQHPHMTKFPPSFPSVATPCLPVRDFVQTCSCFQACLSWLEEGASLLSPFLYREKAAPIFWIDLLLRALELFPLLEEEEKDCLSWKHWILEKKRLWESITSLVDPELFWEKLYKESCSLFEGWEGSEAVDVVTFAPLLVMKALPYRLIMVMGLDESSFPRSDREEWMCGGALREYHPSSALVERYAFLEAICAAQDRLILLYSPSHESQTREDIHASPVVEELLAFLEKEGLETTARPYPDALHQLHAVRDKPFLHSSSKEEATEWLRLIPFTTTLTLQECRTFLQQPASFFLRRLLREKSLKVCDPLGLCSKQFFFRKVLREQDQKAAQDWIYSTWPSSFATFEERVMLSQVRQEAYQISCCLACLRPEKVDSHRYLFPALQIGKKWITGFFSSDLSVDEEGMLLPQALSVSVRSFLPYLPDILAFRLLPPAFGFEGKIRLESGLSLSFLQEDAEQLLHMLFQICLQGSTCLLPWPFLSHSKQEHRWNKSASGTTPHSWLLKRLEDSLSVQEKERLFEKGWASLVLPFEKKVKELFFQLFGGGLDAGV
ncbi:exodeoxyribonuclease V subunit gamma [Candidatus Similichlamydia laticola]|nr:exodeoxyribonuclease V subunit gamma [Candidatus Similichlamydia laticola]